MIDKKLLDYLVCPVSKAPLRVDYDTSELVCDSSRLAYPIENGIPVMLESRARAVKTQDSATEQNA